MCPEENNWDDEIFCLVILEVVQPLKNRLLLYAMMNAGWTFLESTFQPSFWVKSALVTVSAKGERADSKFAVPELKMRERLALGDVVEGIYIPDRYLGPKGPSNSKLYFFFHFRGKNS